MHHIKLDNVVKRVRVTQSQFVNYSLGGPYNLRNLTAIKMSQSHILPPPAWKSLSKIRFHMTMT